MQMGKFWDITRGVFFLLTVLLSDRRVKYGQIKQTFSENNLEVKMFFRHVSSIDKKFISYKNLDVL